MKPKLTAKQKEKLEKAKKRVHALHLAWQRAQERANRLDAATDQAADKLYSLQREFDSQ